MGNRRRTTIQTIAFLLQNANWKGFIKGEIYQGPVKNACVPGLNCYSCPGAVGSCPIGALQNSLTGYKIKLPYYVLGLLIFFGVILGRIVCGFLCPVGLLQDILNKIPGVKKVRTFVGDRWLRFLKYVVLILLVVVLPIFVKFTPFFCKYLCPSGTISGLLLAITNKPLFAQMGKIFTWKLMVLIALLAGSVIIYRPFCKYLCPLGAWYGLFNKVSVVQMSVDSSKCTHCNRCAQVCEMCVNPAVNPNSMECIRCGKCIDACANEALSITAFCSPRKRT